MNDFFIDVLAWFEKKGMLLGIGLVFLPVLYDLIGMLYGRDLTMKIYPKGVAVMILGAVCMVISKYAKQMWRKQ